MKQLWVAVIVSLVSLMGAAEAWGCSLIIAGREDLRYQDTLRDQQGLLSHADAVFLARATPREGVQSELTSFATIAGSAPPQKSSYDVDKSCFDVAPEGVVIVFAYRLRARHFPFQPWRWGEWFIASYIYPHQVVDPKMVTALQETAERLRSKR